MAPPPLALMQPKSRRPAPALDRRYRPGGAVDPNSVGLVITGRRASDQVQLDGMVVDAPLDDAILLTPDRRTRVSVVGADGVMRSVLATLRRSPPRYVARDTMPVVARTDGGAIPSPMARLELVGFDPDVQLFANGVPVSPFARDVEAQIASYAVPPVLTRLGVLLGRDLWEGTVSPQAGEMIDILPGDVSVAVGRPWYLDENMRPMTTAAPTQPPPPPSQSPAATMGVTQPPASSLAPTPTSPTSTSAPPALVKVATRVPGTVVTIDGAIVSPDTFVAPGVYEVGIAAPGYQTKKEWVRVGKGGVAEVDGSLAPLRTYKPLVIGTVAVAAVAGVGLVAWAVARRLAEPNRVSNPSRRRHEHETLDGNMSAKTQAALRELVGERVTEPVRIRNATRGLASVLDRYGVHTRSGAYEIAPDEFADVVISLAKGDEGDYAVASDLLSLIDVELV